MKAVIKTGGKQYYVSEGESIYVEKLDQEAGSEVVFDQVLMIDSKVGNPYLDGATVVGKLEFLSILKNLKQAVVAKDIDNHTLKFLLKKLMVNQC